MMKTQQTGAALLLIFIILILSTTAVFLTAYNDKQDYQVARLEKTEQALAHAKDALIGFALTYRQSPDHDSNRIGNYLPCPDQTGDGSASTCGGKHKTALGRFPWRTLGVPPLRDGDGACLWYAVSGTFKDNPKPDHLTSDTDGLLVVQDANGNIIAGDSAINQAIAIIFAPGKPIGNQTRERGSSGDVTECGMANAPSASINQASQFLDSLGGINNADGGGNLTAHDTANRLFLHNTEFGLTTFVSAPVTYDSNGAEIFNDKALLITPKDFAGVYQSMDLEVAKRATQCIRDYYRQHNHYSFFNQYEAIIGEWDSPAANTYRAAHATEIDDYVDRAVASCKLSRCDQDCTVTCADKAAQCKTNCIDTACENACDAQIPTCETDCTNDKMDCKTDCDNMSDSYRKNSIEIDVFYPWAAEVTDLDYIEDLGVRFGRIPDSLTQSNSVNNDLSTDWWDNCFNTSDPDWAWWDSWKDQVFYAVDDDYTPKNNTNMWIKTARAEPDGFGGWVEESWSDFQARTNTLKDNTIARIKPTAVAPYNADDWTYTTPHTNGTTEIRLGGSYSTFVVIVGGRRLLLNPGGGEPGYPEYAQVRDSATDRKLLENYLEGERHPTKRLRLLAGGNLAAAESTGDRDFIREELAIDFFTDFGCKSGSWECKNSLE